jgi:uncharacterized protein (UPF0332 family)
VTGAGRRESTAAELALAEEELRAAEGLLAAGIPRVAMARVYFAAFHAARARLFADGLEAKSHAEVQHLFNLNLVRPGIYEPAAGRLLARLQKYREEADYATAFVVDEAGAREELENAERFVRRVREEIRDGHRPVDSDS